MLKNWLDQQAVDNVKHYTDMVSHEGTKLEDLAKASANVQVDDGIEKFMDATLSGEKLTAFKADRMLEKVDGSTASLALMKRRAAKTS